VEENTDNIFDSAAQQYEAAAAELDRAAKHLRWTAEHFRIKEAPRARAHVVAAQGHLSKVDKQLRELAELHSTKAQV